MIWEKIMLVEFVEDLKNQFYFRFTSSFYDFERSRSTAEKLSEFFVCYILMFQRNISIAVCYQNYLFIQKGDVSFLSDQ